MACVILWYTIVPMVGIGVEPILVLTKRRIVIIYVTMRPPFNAPTWGVGDVVARQHRPVL